MAEARQAVAFSFNLSSSGGLHFYYDVELIRDIWHTLVQDWRLTFLRLKNNISNSVFPLNPWTFLVFWFIATILMFNPIFPIRDPTWGVAAMVVKFFPFEKFWFAKFSQRVTELIVIYGLYYVVWLFHVQGVRWTLFVLLHYRRIMYERSGLSMTTKIWAMVLKYSTWMRKPKLYSYEGILPYLPLPSLEHTIKNYLLSVRPLLNDDDFEKMQQLSESFRKNEGRKFQRYLWIKWLLTSNYVSDWWERFVYLRSRTPLLVNSNFYGIDNINIGSTRQTSRAANIIHSMIKFRSKLQYEQWKPMMLGDLIPLSSAQHERQFDTTRIPGVEADRLRHFKSSTHVVVLHRGRYYEVYTHYRGDLLMPADIELQLEKIVSDTSQPAYGEEKLAALTAGERSHWAETRTRYFQRGGINNMSLDSIERAAFVVALDDVEYAYDPNNPTGLDKYAHWLLCGDGTNRWCDKSYTVCIMKNARAGINVEHSWADAPVSAAMFESVLVEDNRCGYREDGRCRGEPRFSLAPVRLRFALNEDCLECIDKSLVVARSLVEDTDLVVLHYTDYGKGFMKTCKVSPDGYIQLVLQLAYYRDTGKLDLTYEASMTRLFRGGRTETVRSVSSESARFVYAMSDASCTNAERREMLKIACNKHQQQYLDCMNGKGIDRHLFALFVISKYTGVRSPFVEAVIQEPWRLSTSQTPFGISGLFDVNAPENLAPGGGFGPVSEDGYGVSYIIVGEVSK